MPWAFPISISWLRGVREEPLRPIGKGEGEATEEGHGGPLSTWMCARRKPSPDSVAQHAAAILEPTGPTGEGEGEEIGAGGGKGAAEGEEEGLQWYVFRNLDLKPGRKWDADFVDYGKHFRSPAEVIEKSQGNVCGTFLRWIRPCATLGKDLFQMECYRRGLELQMGQDSAN